MNEIVIKIEGLDELTRALQALAAGNVQQVSMQAGPAFSAQTAVSQMPKQAQQQAVPVTAPQMQAAAPQQTVPVQMAQSQIPVQQPVNAPVQVPTTAAPQQYSFDQLAVALSNLCANMNKQAEVHALLNQFGVNDLFSLPKEKYGEFATAIRGIGGVI
ncbi:MAG: hypothetical protein UFG06_05105 [Lachnospiraceae bacterium]|nr:hypothetical protein [Lachnospiraceae bacterium]